MRATVRDRDHNDAGNENQQRDSEAHAAQRACAHKIALLVRPRAILTRVLNLKWDTDDNLRIIVLHQRRILVLTGDGVRRGLFHRVQARKPPFFYFSDRFGQLRGERKR